MTRVKNTKEQRFPPAVGAGKAGRAPSATNVKSTRPASTEPASCRGSATARRAGAASCATRVKTFFFYVLNALQSCLSSSLSHSLSCFPRSQLLHASPPLSQRRHLHEHRTGQLYVHVPARFHGSQLRAGDARVRQQPLQERRHLHSESGASASNVHRLRAT